MHLLLGVGFKNPDEFDWTGLNLGCGGGAGGAKFDTGAGGGVGINNPSSFESEEVIPKLPNEKLIDEKHKTNLNKKT